MTDRQFCINSYLMFRYVFDANRCFDQRYPCRIVNLDFDRVPIKSADELIDHLTRSISRACEDGKTALALSGGIDSAILARLVPAGTKAYTFRCVIPGRSVIDESSQAGKWATICNLDHEVIDISWENIDGVVDELMVHKGAPIHSIEAQIYIAAKKAKASGFSRFMFGENADIIYGGMNGLLAKDWSYAEFVDRYSYVMPYKVLKHPEMIMEPFLNFEKSGKIDGHDFINTYFRQEALGTYHNACDTAGISFFGPYSETYLDAPIDYARIRGGESKYIIREVFHRLYPDEMIPDKIPMPRPTSEWFAEWSGPVRDEFIPDCAVGLSGDQKWMLWALERFLNILDREK